MGIRVFEIMLYLYVHVYHGMVHTRGTYVLYVHIPLVLHFATALSIAIAIFQYMVHLSACICTRVRIQAYMLADIVVAIPAVDLAVEAVV